MNLIKRFYHYQNERFPLKILLFTTSAVVLSSAAVLSYQTNIIAGVAALVGSLAYLFHVRVIDESRDLEHDNQFHPDRPVQRGLITIKELLVFDIVGVLLLIAVSILYKQSGLLWGAALLVFSTLAWKDFFLGERFKKAFYLYNALNMLQMVLLQLFIYAVLSKTFSVTGVMWIHLVFVLLNTVLIEMVRKIKTQAHESKGADTYSWYMGFRKSILTFYVFTLVNFGVFIWMIYAIRPTILNYLLIATALMLLVTFSVFFHLSKKEKKTEQLMLLTTVINYIGLNLLIYFFNA